MTLTTEGYCDKHQADLNPKRDSSSARLYGYKWRKESKLYLASHPYCAECARQGRRTLAAEVDHIKPHKGDLQKQAYSTRPSCERTDFMKSRQVSAKVPVTCNVCGESILLDTSKLKSKHFPDGIHIDYFSCEKCGAKFIYLVTDMELRKDIKRRGWRGF